MKEKKKFKDTAVGQWLKNNVPDVLDKVDDYIPMVSILTNAVKEKNLPPEKQFEFDQLILNHEKSMYELEVRDRESARQIKPDWMMRLVGCWVMCLTTFVVYAIFYTNIVASEMAHLIAGEIIGFAASVVMLFYGASYSRKTPK